MGTILFGRMVGLVVETAMVAVAALLWIAVAADTPEAGDAPSEGLIFGIWSYLYAMEAPPQRVIWTAVALAVLFAAGVALLERRVTNKSRRAANTRTGPLAPKIVMNATRGVSAGPVHITVLIPTYNEAASLSATLTSLLSQSHRPERVIVVADNCTDDTAAIEH